MILEHITTLQTAGRPTTWDWPRVVPRLSHFRWSSHHILLAVLANAVWLRSYSRANIPKVDRRLAPVLALCVSGIVGLGVACFWVFYQLGMWL